MHIKQQRMELENMCTALDLTFISFPSDTELRIQIKFHVSLINICRSE